MRSVARLRTASQIGQRQRHFISWNRTTKETGSELIQAIALKGKNCHGKSATRTSIANSTLSFHEISRSYLLASQVHLHLRVVVTWKIEHDTQNSGPWPSF
jgi:hypothetical protein